MAEFEFRRKNCHFYISFLIYCTSTLGCGSHLRYLLGMNFIHFKKPVETLCFIFIALWVHVQHILHLGLPRHLIFSTQGQSNMDLFNKILGEIFPSLQEKKKVVGYFEPKAKCRPTPSLTIRPIGFCTSQTSKLSFLVPKGFFPSLQKKGTRIFWTQGKMSLGL